MGFAVYDLDRGLGIERGGRLVPPVIDAVGKLPRPRARHPTPPAAFRDLHKVRLVAGPKIKMGPINERRLVRNAAIRPESELDRTHCGDGRNDVNTHSGP